MISGGQGPEAQTATEKHPQSPGSRRGPEESSEPSDQAFRATAAPGDHLAQFFTFKNVNSCRKN